MDINFYLDQLQLEAEIKISPSLKKILNLPLKLVVKTLSNISKISSELDIEDKHIKKAKEIIKPFPKLQFREIYTPAKNGIPCYKKEFKKLYNNAENVLKKDVPELFKEMKNYGRFSSLVSIETIEYCIIEKIEYSFFSPKTLKSIKKINNDNEKISVKSYLLVNLIFILKSIFTRIKKDNDSKPINKELHYLLAFSIDLINNLDK